MSWGCLVAVGLAIVGPAAAAHAADIRVAILQYGLFTTEELEPSTGTDGKTMRAAIVTNVCHVMTTSIVPAGGGPEFGVSYRVVGSPTGTPVDITRVLRYPDPRTHGPSVSYVTNRQRVRMPIGGRDYFGWANRRIIPGTWTFQIWEGDRMLAEAVFTAVDRKAFTLRSNDESSCFLMSALEGAMKWHWT
jgi:hypothetical protein